MKGLLSRTKARLAKKIGPLPAWAWAAIGVVGLVVWQRRKYASPATSGSATAATGGDYWQGGGGSGSSNGAGAGSSGGGGTGGGGSGVGKRRKPRKHPGNVKPSRHKHRRRKAPKPPLHAGGGGAGPPQKASAVRMSVEPAGRTHTEKALPLAASRGPAGPLSRREAHAIPSGRPLATVQAARHTTRFAAPELAPTPKRGVRQRLSSRRGRRG